MKTTNIVVGVSGYFDPLHVGHLEYFQRAKEFASRLSPDARLFVIVNNDHQARLKKGKSFMKEEERVTIIRALRMVDDVILSIDNDRTVCHTIEEKCPFLTHFVNGGDQFNTIIPERPICEGLGIQLLDGFGDKIQSSSWLTGLSSSSSIS